MSTKYQYEESYIRSLPEKLSELSTYRVYLVGLMLSTDYPESALYETKLDTLLLEYLFKEQLKD